MPPVGGDIPGGYGTPFGMIAGTKPVWAGTREDPYSIQQGHYCKSTQLLDDNQTWRIEYKQKPKFKWENEKDVLIQDRYWKEVYDLEYQKLTLDTIPDWKEIRMVDDYTMEQVYKKKIHPGSFFTGRHAEIRRPRWFVKPWAEKMMDATTESEAQEINKNMTSSENVKGLSDFPSMGVFKLKEIQDVDVVFTKNDIHPYSDKQNIDQMIYRFKGNQAAKRLSWENGQIDSGTPPQNTQLPDGFTTKSRRTPRSAGLWLNRYNNPHLKRRGVRRAIAYALNNTGICANTTADTFKTVLSQCGMPEVVAKRWHPNYKKFKKKAIDYGQSARPDEAAQALKSEGYKKQNGNWVGPDGNTLEFHYIDLEWWPMFPRTIKNNLERIGIKINVEKASQNYDTLILQDDRDWNICTASHGPRYNYYVGGCFTNKSYGPLGGFPIEDFQHEKKTQFGIPHEVTIPKEPGVKEVSGGGETINLVEVRDIFSDVEATKEELTEATEILARYWQYDMPKPLVGDAIVLRTRNTGDFVWKDINGDGTDMSQFEAPVAMHLGKMHAKTK